MGSIRNNSARTREIICCVSIDTSDRVFSIYLSIYYYTTQSWDTIELISSWGVVYAKCQTLCHSAQQRPHPSTLTSSEKTFKIKFAVKSLCKEKIKEKHQLIRELETLHEVDHQNIIRLYEVLKTHLVIELCTGGDLLTHILATQPKAAGAHPSSAACC